MKKTIGLAALLISSAAVLVQPALAQDRDDYGNRYEAPRYTQQVRRDVRPDFRNSDRNDDRRDYRRVDVRNRRDFDRR